MATEQLTYDHLAERLAPHARPPAPSSNAIAYHDPAATMARPWSPSISTSCTTNPCPRGHREVTSRSEAVATLKARVAELEAELAKAEERSAGHRADLERERDRTDQMVTAQDRLITELENLRTLLQTAQQPATPQPASRLVRAWRWVRATA